MAKFLDLKNTRTRTMLLLGIVLLFIVILIIYFSTKKTNVLQGQESHTGKLPQIESIPGGVTSEKYQQLQEEENRKRAEAALKTGTSAVATIIGAQGTGGIAGKETFGIEDQLLKGNCNCPQPGAECDYFNPAIAQKLIADIQADNTKAAPLINQNPCLPRALCKSNFDLAVKLALADKALAKIFLNECPDMAKALAEKNPAYFKQLMLENPELARKLAEKNPELFKKLILEDPEFAKQLAKNNPELIKTLMKNDPAFAKQMMEKYPDMVKELMANDPAFAEAMRKAVPELANKLLPPPAPPVVEVVAPPRKVRARAEGPLQLSELQQKQMQNLVAAMDAQSKAAMQSWNEVTVQQFVAGEWRAKEEQEKRAKAKAAAAAGPGGAAAAAAVAPVLIKAGTVLFAVLDTEVSSDEPGPILATVVSGKYKGAKLLGSMTANTIPGMDTPEKVTLNFSIMNIPEAPQSIAIQAVAIDQDTARTALATEVDRHYILRYASLFASALMVGYAKVITSMGTTNTQATNGQSVTTISPNLTSRQQLYAALGQVGQQWGQAIQSVVNRPYTIIVASGTGLGILFTADVATK